VESAEAIVNALLEDIDADLPSHKSEVRILPTSDPRRFDVTLLTGFDPVYIGTLGHQGNVWKPVEVMPGVGREFRAKLHFVGPNKEDVAMAMVQTLRPIWKRKIAAHLTSQVESEDVDPKNFIQKIGHDVDIKRVIEANYPAVEVLGIKTDPGYRLRYTVTIRSKDPAQPLWHKPIYAMIQDLQKKLWDLYGWRMRPYLNQQNYPESNKIGGIAGIKPINICYDTATGVQGTLYLLIDFDILQKDEHGGYAEQADWGTPYGSPGEQQRESVEEIDKEAAKAEKPASPEQAEAGNYRKGHVSVQGMEIAIENAEGSTRSGTGKDGKTWSVTMPAHYGYLKGTQGKDKDHLDVYIGPKPNGMMVFVVNQKKEEGGFDEHKIMLGFSSKDEAIETYDRAFSSGLGPKLRETVVSTTVDKLKEWIASGNTKKPFDGIVEGLLEADEIDSKSLAMRTPMRPIPRTYGDLKVGDVVYVSETGSFQRIEGHRPGHGASYQDETGALQHSSRPTTFVRYSEFSPAYAYGYYVQRLSIDARHGLFGGSELAELPDTSDAALWKLVDEEMVKYGRPQEEIDFSREQHRAWLVRPEQQAARDAQERLDQMMGVPPPPQNESDEVDPKAFLGGHELPVTLTPQHDNAWWVERKEDHYPLGQLIYDLHDDAPTPEARANWADTNWIAIPITPSVQPKGFKDQDEAIQFLLQHGNR
jgi:hypothetical protein